MKKLVLSLCLFAAVSAAHALQEEALPMADEELIMELKEYCQDEANDQGTDGMPMTAFLLQCLNNELTLEGYQTLKKLPE